MSTIAEQGIKNWVGYLEKIRRSTYIFFRHAQTDGDRVDVIRHTIDRLEVSQVVAELDAYEKSDWLWRMLFYFQMKEKKELLTLYALKLGLRKKTHPEECGTEVDAELEEKDRNNIIQILSAWEIKGDINNSRIDMKTNAIDGKDVSKTVQDVILYEKKGFFGKIFSSLWGAVPSLNKNWIFRYAMQYFYPLHSSSKETVLVPLRNAQIHEHLKVSNHNVCRFLENSPDLILTAEENELCEFLLKELEGVQKKSETKEDCVNNLSKQAALRKAYFTLSQYWHPDTGGQEKDKKLCGEKFQTINNAYVRLQIALEEQQDRREQKSRGEEYTFASFGDTVKDRMDYWQKYSALIKTFEDLERACEEDKKRCNMLSYRMAVVNNDWKNMHEQLDVHVHNVQEYVKNNEDCKSAYKECIKVVDVNIGLLDANIRVADANIKAADKFIYMVDDISEKVTALEREFEEIERNRLSRS